MILSGLLSESNNLGNFNTEDVEPIVKAHYTANSTGVQAILFESDESHVQLEENVMLAEQIVLSLQVKGDEAAAESLSEGMVGDYFNKMIEGLKKLWQKIKGWFANIFKSLEVATRDINSIITKYEKEIKGKDFSNFEYKGHKWKSGAIEGVHTSATTKANTIMGHLSALPGSSAIGDTEKPTEHAKEQTANKHLGALLGQDDMSQAEAKKHVLELVTGSEKEETIKNFSDISVTDMIAFVKDFKNSKTIKKAQADTDKLFSKAIADAQKIIKEVEVQHNKGDFAEGKKEHSQKNIALAKHNVNSMRNLLAGYNTLTGVCVDLEKMQFSEYKKVIAAAIRHKGK